MGNSYTTSKQVLSIVETLLTHPVSTDYAYEINQDTKIKTSYQTGTFFSANRTTKLENKTIYIPKKDSQEYDEWMKDMLNTILISSIQKIQNWQEWKNLISDIKIKNENNTDLVLGTSDKTNYVIIPLTHTITNDINANTILNNSVNVKKVDIDGTLNLTLKANFPPEFSAYASQSVQNFIIASTAGSIINELLHNSDSSNFISRVNAKLQAQGERFSILAIFVILFMVVLAGSILTVLSGD